MSASLVLSELPCASLIKEGLPQILESILMNLYRIAFKLNIL